MPSNESSIEWGQASSSCVCGNNPEGRELDKCLSCDVPTRSHQLQQPRQNGSVGLGMLPPTESKVTEGRSEEEVGGPMIVSI
eukprot:CAMPEP_0184662728 /NCGR_PEP_ID=MMETSP0308-20130426/44685_1 /TAXON_ID=38269 /ORGANISM="Gloeochaete witrockiana, Strain SAG 46.84" /LENGTH=81 /DNA_ID=CAMNT_0027104947 /DNA_START=61 /DNA_END=303 /DNA_ORIENTATION=-